MVCQRPRGPRWLTEALRRLTERPRGSPWLTEALRRLTEAWRICTGAGDNGVGGGGPRSGGSWACAGAGVLVCRCAGVLVCRCASVLVCRRSRWCTNILVCNTSVDFAMISLQLSYVFAIIILWFSSAPLMFVFGFLQVFRMVLLWCPVDFLRIPIVCLWFPMFSFQIHRMFVWFSCEFPSEFLWSPEFS